MKIKRGFTLIEVLISLSIFAYVFSALIILFFQLSKGMDGTGKCSSFSFIIIQKVLTETSSMQVATSGLEATFDNQILLAEPTALYLYEKSELNNFLENKSDFQLDSCNVKFSKNSTTTINLVDPSKCLDFKYEQGATQTICALK